MPATAPSPSAGRGFSRALQAAVSSLERPRIGIVVRTPPRGSFLRDLCVHAAPSAERITVYLEEFAEDGFAKQEHTLVVLDASVDPAFRAILRTIARDRVPDCGVIEIRKWSAEPPA